MTIQSTLSFEDKENATNFEVVQHGNGKVVIVVSDINKLSNDEDVLTEVASVILSRSDVSKLSTFLNTEN